MKNISDEQLKKKLTSKQYDVVVNKATEEPFSGELLFNHKKGIYECIVCGHILFSSDAKFDSGTGWPSFDEPMNLQNVELKEDTSHSMIRTEVICKNCGAHLGHLFDDGPTKTGQRFCINSCALNFKPS